MRDKTIKVYLYEESLAMVIWASLFPPHCSSSPSCVDEHLDIDNGGYLCMNSLCSLITVWLNVSKRNQVRVRLNRSARE